MTFPWDSLIPAMRNRQILNRHFLSDENIRLLKEDLHVDSDKAVCEKVAHLLCYLFGKFIITDCNGIFISSTLLVQAYQTRKNIWALIDKAYREGNNDAIILDNAHVKALLEGNKSLFCDRNPIETVQEEARFAALALPMPLQDLLFFKRKPLTPPQIVLVEGQLRQSTSALYRQLLLHPSTTSMTPGEWEEVELLFYSKAWGFVQRQYFSWGEIVKSWSSANRRLASCVENFMNHFRFPIIAKSRHDRKPIPAELEILALKARAIKLPFFRLYENDLQAYSVILTIQAFMDCRSLELIPPIIELLFYELYHDELLRQEMFVCLDYTPEICEEMKSTKVRFGSPIFDEVFDMIKMAIDLKQSTRGQYSWYIEALYRAPPQVRTATQQRIQEHHSDFFNSLSRLSLALKKSKMTLRPENLLKIVILSENSKGAELIQNLPIFAELEISMDIDSFLLYFLEHPDLDYDLNQLQIQLGVLQSKIRTTFDFITFPDEALKIQLALEVAKNPDLSAKVDIFISKFFKDEKVKIDGNTLYHALLRFCKGEFALEEVDKLKNFPFQLSTAEQIEFFAVPKHAWDSEANTQDIVAAVRNLQKDYKFTELQAVRLCFRFSPFEDIKKELNSLIQFLQLLERTTRSPLSRELRFQLFFLQPFPQLERAYAFLQNFACDLTSIGDEATPQVLYGGREALQRQLYEITRATLKPGSLAGNSPTTSSTVISPPPPLVQQLQHQLYELFMPNMQNLLPLLDLQAIRISDELISLTSLKSQNLGVLSFLSSDLPSGRMCVGQWITPEKMEQCPYLEITLINPINFNSRSFYCPWRIPLKDLVSWPSLLKLLPLIAELIIRKTPVMTPPPTTRSIRKNLTDPISIPATGLDLSPQASLRSMIEDPDFQKLIDYHIQKHPHKAECAQKTLEFLKALMHWYYSAHRELVVGLHQPCNFYLESKERCKEGNTFLLQQEGSKAVVTLANPSHTPDLREFTLPSAVVEHIPILIQKLREKKDISLTTTGQKLQGFTLSQVLDLPLYWQFNAQTGALTFKLPNLELTWTYSSFIDHPLLENLLHIHLLQLLSCFYRSSQGQFFPSLEVKSNTV